MTRTFIVERSQDYIMLKAIFPEPCKSFAKYKARCAPTCGCLPCVEKYVNAQAMAGRNTREITNQVPVKP